VKVENSKVETEKKRLYLSMDTRYLHGARICTLYMCAIELHEIKRRRELNEPVFKRIKLDEGKFFQDRVEDLDEVKSNA